MYFPPRRPDFPARCLAGFLGLALLLVSAAPVALADAGPANRPPVDLFFDFARDKLIAAGTGPDGALLSPQRVGQDGIPLNLGVEDGPAYLGWRMVAGARGRYMLGLADGLAMVVRGKASHTAVFDDPMASHVDAAGATEFRLAADGWTVGLTPGIAVARGEAGGLRQDASAEGRVVRAMGGGFGILAAARYRWRVTDGLDAPPSDLASARIGLTGALPGRVRLELAYLAGLETWQSAEGYAGPAASLSTGPSFAIALPIDRVLDLRASYAVSDRSNRYFAAGPPPAAGNSLENAGIGLVWDLDDDLDQLGNLRLSAAYRYERQGFDDGHDEIRHTGTLNLLAGF